MTELILASNNEHKAGEIQAAIGDKVLIKSLKQVGIEIDIPEPHDTLEANSIEKCRVIHNLTGKNCIGEDTGLEVEELNGEPGVKSARYAGEDRSFDKNIEKVLTRLKGKQNREARFRTVISLIWENQEYQFEGICEGKIIEQPSGAKGFGYDPIFCPSGTNRTFAEMDVEEKNEYSHRRKAADKLIQFLKTQR